MEDKLQVALEERKIIQNIIHNQEEIRMKLVGWCITIVSGFIIAFHSNKIAISGTKFGLFTLLVVIVFLILDITNRSVFYKMLKRSKTVEKMIQNGASKYDGFKIEESMAEPMEKKNVVYDFRLFSPYIALIIIIAISFFAKRIIG